MRNVIFLSLTAFVLATACPVAAQVSLKKAPATAGKQPSSAKPATKAANCYTPPVRRGVKTPMSALPPPGICVGTQVKQGGVVYCYNCGTSSTPVSGGCVSCNAGYTWNAATKSCCKGAGPALPPPK
jgi:hypothetical protein